ncbi:fdxN element excision recombinase XisF [Rivularia sp. UHCC 0363]|uniref:fdxN element excision recombinase XisF n=1 Tax=Rivularia sp. UHCC 0363 TaxID=3110244 RepID=UPI002B1EF779|nr:fdxN element excision recombinase XisF [Rivularia sp. UHCC 0363]MEA5595501.1 fdxN element excision recombinase XisF [Rivularia sp. UHCC 0363]
MRDLSRALGYCRVSTQRQHTEGHGLERYIERLKQYGLTEEQIHWDIESGASDKRKGYNQVLELVRSHQVDQIIVPCFDRFTRSALGWEVARQELQKFGVELVFLDGGSLDLDTPEGLFTSRILAAMSAQVRDKNRYNAIQGHRYFQEKKKIYQAVFGFVKDGDRVVPNTKQYRDTDKTHAEVALLCVEMFIASGELSKTIRRLTDKYGLERVGKYKYEDFPRDVSSFRRWLSNPQLCGMVCYYAFDNEKKVILQSEHQGIISVAQHQQIIQILSTHPCGRRKYVTNPLVGLCKCAECGSTMEKRSTKVNGKTYEHLKCPGAYPKPRQLKKCSVRTYFRLEGAIDAAIQALKGKAENIAENMPIETTEEIPVEILELQQQIFKLKQLNDPDFNSTIKIKEQKLETTIKTSELNVVADAGRTQVLRNIASHFGFWEVVTREELTAIFHELVAEVVCSVSARSQSFAARLKI